jgi:hypothetical protein
MSCIFCARDTKRGSSSREHLWAAWVRDNVPVDDTAGAQTISVGTRVIERRPRRTPGALEQISIGNVCRDCNHGWLERLETATKAFAIDLILGNVRTLAPAEIRLLARWASVRCLVHEQTHPQTATIPDEWYAWSRLNDLPLPTSRMWVAAGPGTSGCTLRIRHTAFTAYRPAVGLPPPARGDSHWTLFFLGELCLIVMQTFGAAPLRPGLSASSSPAIKQLWPYAGPIATPVLPRLTTAEVASLFDGWRTVQLS